MADTIICIRWGTAFSSADVNMLYRAGRAHLAGDLRFVCLTDDASGLLAEIEARDIPDIGLTDPQLKRPGVWRKLSLFSPELADLGRVLFVDLDMMIVGDLAPFFAVTEDATFLNMGASWRPDPTSDARETGTAVFSYDPGAEPQVLAAFLADPEAALASFPHAPDFVGAHVRKARFWPEGLVLSFKRHLCHRYGGPKAVREAARRAAQPPR